MSSEPSERAWQWIEKDTGGRDVAYEAEARAFDAGHTEGEKKGTAVGYLAALQEASKELGDVAGDQRLEVPDVANAALTLRRWLDRRIREAEENAK